MSNMIQEEPTFPTADKFLDFLNPSKKPWRDANYPTWIFRGQWDGRAEPTPSAWRKTNRRFVEYGFKQWLHEHEEDGSSKAIDDFAKFKQDVWPDATHPHLREHIRFCIGERWL